MTFRLLAFRLLSLVAVAVSAAMVLDAYLPAPAFCGFRAGCDEVTHSAFGQIAGIPLSLWGLLAFAAFYTLTLFPDSKLGQQIGTFAIVAGMVGLALVAAQVFLLKQTCPFCLIIDTCGILLAAVELGLPPAKPPVTNDESTTEVAAAKPPSMSNVQRNIWIAIGLLVAAAPVVWMVVKPPPEVPAQVKALWAEGRINVIELTDFTCPHCRASHAVIDEFVAAHADEIHFVRVIVPLKHHANSRPAALAYLCAERQGLGEAMADALFLADDHSPEAVAALAEELGLDAAAFSACMSDSALDAEIDETLAWVEAADTGGLPQIWIDDIVLIGQQTPASLESALRRVADR